MATKRSENDFYPTDPRLTEMIVGRLKLLYPDPDFLIEPSAGSGRFLVPARKAWPDKQIHAVELRGEERDACLRSGATTFTEGDWVQTAYSWWERRPPPGRCLVFGNPPFSLAMEHILAPLDLLLPGSMIAFLLKMNFFGSADRYERFWPRAYGELKYFIPIVPRPSFKQTEKSTTDQNEYSIFIWEVGWSGGATILFPHIKWR